MRIHGSSFLLARLPGRELLMRYVGDSEEAVRQIFNPEIVDQHKVSIGNYERNKDDNIFFKKLFYSSATKVRYMLS